MPVRRARRATIRQKLIGQAPFKKELRKQVGAFRLFNSIGEQPILSMLLLGPSGVGKTRGAASSCSHLGENQRIADSLIAGIGAKRASWKNRARSFLIDEFEKADPAVWNFFLDLAFHRLAGRDARPRRLCRSPTSASASRFAPAGPPASKARPVHQHEADRW